MKFFESLFYFVWRLLKLLFVYAVLIVAVYALIVIFWGTVGVLIAHSLDLGKTIAMQLSDPAIWGTLLACMLFFHGIGELNEKRKSRKREALKPDWLKECDRERDEFINSIRERFKS